MADLNNTLFLLINAPAHPDAWMLLMAKLLAEYAIGLVPVTLVLGWLYGRESTRHLLLAATAAGLLGLLANQVIGLFWQHPRPFMVGLGHTLIAHGADSSFPSDHLTLIWALAFSLCGHAATRSLGAALALLGLPVAWARIYLGVHYPLDMVGAAGVAALCAWLSWRQRHWFLAPAYQTIFALHQLLFSPLIQRGWVRR
jgi:undecaprenyl-diphosphatase